MLGLYYVKQFGVQTGLKREDMGRDGYTRFVPPDDAYDPARAAVHLRDTEPSTPGGARNGDAAGWRFPALEVLRNSLLTLLAATHKVLFFLPYHHRLLPLPNSGGAQVWDECKRRVFWLVASTPGAIAVDFMLPSPITLTDDNYWDPKHHRVAVADQLALDLTAADRGQPSTDYRLQSSGPPGAGVNATDAPAPPARSPG